LKGVEDAAAGNGNGNGVKRGITIPAPRIQVIRFDVCGDSPYVQQRFSQKAAEQIKATQEAGSAGKSKKARPKKDFQQCYRDALHESTEGWYGFPASAIRSAMISACRLVQFKMTLAKLSVFVAADGYDKVDGIPLVRITKGKPHYSEHWVRLPNGSIDLRARPMWDPGWEATITIRYDEDQFTAGDIANLLARVGGQVGIGEGRADSRDGAGMGWGSFKIANRE
jgi:hypothetical protein